MGKDKGSYHKDSLYKKLFEYMFARANHLFTMKDLCKILGFKYHTVRTAITVAMRKDIVLRDMKGTNYRYYIPKIVVVKGWDSFLKKYREAQYDDHILRKREGDIMPKKQKDTTAPAIQLVTEICFSRKNLIVLAKKGLESSGRYVDKNCEIDFSLNIDELTVKFIDNRLSKGE